MKFDSRIKKQGTLYCIDCIASSFEDLKNLMGSHFIVAGIFVLVFESFSFSSKVQCY